MLGILGTKIGMSQIINDDGNLVPVTYVQALPNEVVQVRSSEKDGYNAVALGYESLKKPKKTQKFRYIKEIIVEDSTQYKVGQKLSLEDLGKLEEANITAYSKGKGFQGTVKRWKFKVARKTHGTKEERHGSSMNNCITGRSRPGLKMSGRMGNNKITLKKRKIILINIEKNIYAIKGAIPGASDGLVILKTTN